MCRKGSWASFLLLAGCGDQSKMRTAEIRLWYLLYVPTSLSNNDFKGGLSSVNSILQVFAQIKAGR